MNMTSILNLNDDCLEEIFSYLQLPELFIVEKTCERFKAICELKYRNYKEYVLLLRNENNQTEEYFSHIGPYLNKLEFSGGYQVNPPIINRIVAIIVAYCTSVEHLILKYLKMSEYLVITLKCLMPQLKSLDIRQCSCDDSCMMGFLSMAENLEKISFNARDSESKGQYLLDFKLENLKEIKLDTAFMELATLTQFLKNLPNLNVLSLDIQYFHFTPEEWHQFLLTVTSELKDLRKFELAHLDELKYGNLKFFTSDWLEYEHKEVIDKFLRLTSESNCFPQLKKNNL